MPDCFAISFLEKKEILHDCDKLQTIFPLLNAHLINCKSSRLSTKRNLVKFSKQIQPTQRMAKMMIKIIMIISAVAK